jgi:Uma2 family endonuclease
VLHAFVAGTALGEALVAPIPVRLRRGKFREPDLAFMLTGHQDRKKADYWDRPDLVMEVVSDDPASRRRDYEEKRQDYARAGIPEYWIVDPQERRVLVLRLEGAAYAVHGEHGPGGRATSALLPGFEVQVDRVFEAAERA